MNKFLKPKNFIKTLQFKQRKAKVYLIFQTQFLIKLTLQKVEVIREREVAIYLENNHLIEFQLIEIVFYHLIEIMLIT
jgi:hypothetical protein